MDMKKYTSNFAFSYVNLKSKVFMKSLESRGFLGLNFFSCSLQEQTFKCLSM